MKKQTGGKNQAGLDVDRCPAITKSGRQCRNGPVSGLLHCFTHANDPQVAEKRAEAQRRGGLHAHYGPDGPERPEVQLRNAEDILALYETCAADILTRPPSMARARALAYVAAQAWKTVEPFSAEQREAAEARRPRNLLGRIY